MKKFTGILARPLPEADEWDSEFEDRVEFFAREKREREEALIRHFGYEPEEREVWYKVALSLAELVVPAYKQPRGRPDEYKLRAVGWAVYWITLRLTDEESATSAYAAVADYVGVPEKTVRLRINEFRKKKPTWFDRIAKQVQDDIGYVGVENALRYGRGAAMPDNFHLWRVASTIRQLEGRPPEPDFASLGDMWDHAEEKADRRK